LSKNVKIRIYVQDYNLPAVLYGCETWSLTLKEEYRLSLFENRVLRRIFGLKRDEVTGEWRKLHNEELCDLYSSPNIIRIINLNWFMRTEVSILIDRIIKSRRMRWAGHVAQMGEKRNMYSYWWENQGERGR
jgi:hypothetical protein